MRRGCAVASPGLSPCCGGPRHGGSFAGCRSSHVGFAMSSAVAPPGVVLRARRNCRSAQWLHYPQRISRHALLHSVLS
jgi:hypothetical protein